jgi:hypothetical protein
MLWERESSLSRFGIESRIRCLRGRGLIIRLTAVVVPGKFGKCVYIHIASIEEIKFGIGGFKLEAVKCGRNFV